jgi:anti-sigma factor RsiW
MNDPHAGVGSYVTDALTPIERAEFDHHLTSCYRCRGEVADFTETLARLTPLLATSPPASLRASVLAAIHTTHPVSPELAGRAEDHAHLIVEPDPTVVRPKAPATVTELRPLSPDEVTPLDEHPSVLPDTSWVGVAASLSDDLGTGRGRRTDKILIGLVAAALIIALVFSGWVYVSWQQNQTQTSQTQAETDLLTADDVTIHSDTMLDTPVSYVVSHDRNEALFIARNLPDPTGDSTYQLWIYHGEAATPAGVISEGGPVRQRLDGSIADADRLVITHEPTPDQPANPTGSVLSEITLP